MSAPSVKPASTRSAFIAWVLPIVVNIVLPIVTYVLLDGAGMAPVPALLISGVWPLVDLVITIAQQHHVDEFAVFVLIGLVVGIATALLSDSTRSVFLKESVTSALLGIAFLVTVPWKPLTFFLGRRFATDGSQAQREWWDGLWVHPRFRLVQRRLGAAWGVALLGEGIVRGILTYTLGTTAMVVANNVVPYLIIAVMIAVSVTVGRREQQRAAREGRAGATPPPAEQVA